MLGKIKNGLKTVGVYAGLCTAVGALATASAYFGKYACKVVCLMVNRGEDKTE